MLNMFSWGGLGLEWLTRIPPHLSTPHPFLPPPACQGTRVKPSLPSSRTKQNKKHLQSQEVCSIN